MRNYIMKEFGEGTDGQFNVMQLNKRWGKLSEKTKQALLPDKEGRELLDKFMKAVDQFGPESLMGPKRTILSQVDPG